MPCRLLIVEDEAPLCTLLHDIFADEGYEVTTAADGREALDALSNQTFDLVMSNIMLPYMDGRELVRHLRADPATRHIPVILMSANQHPATAEAVGADTFVAKPFDLDALLSTVERVADTAYG